ncbi:MAG TPA: selenocysteine-specific translation elongation factor [Eubacteriaceae bacterium]|nr:selenocysteine-specific translation elongation factor [Eubacteriaceae bacterium]
MKHVTMGTAGHIDHGKTLLVRQLTGIETDRLSEEKKRGMTIELGFAAFSLSDSETISIVDVPGHEKFVKTMVAGVSGIDFVLLVIAADEGIMPQTKEHIDILSVLGISQGIIALTKTDLVDERTVQDQSQQIRSYLKDTPLRNFPILPVSSYTGEGLDLLKHEIRKQTEEIPAKEDSAIFQMPVDRVFTLSGHGTIVTGTIGRGSIRKGDVFRVFPQNRICKVRNLQVRGESVEEAYRGDRCAINVSGVDKNELSRGTLAVSENIDAFTQQIDARIQMVSESKKLSHNQRVHVHIGTKSVIARVRILEQDAIMENEKGYVQLRLEEPIGALRGDPLILRFYSPPVTIGGGEVLFHQPPHRKRFGDEVLVSLKLSENRQDHALVDHLLSERFSFMTSDQLFQILLTSKEDVERHLHLLLQEKRAVYHSANQKYMSMDVYKEITKTVKKELDAYINNREFTYQLNKQECKSRLFPHFSDKDFLALLTLLEEDQVLKNKGKTIEPYHNRQQNEMHSKKEVKLVNRIFEEDPFQVLTAKQVAAKTGLKETQVLGILKFLTGQSQFIELEPGAFTRVDSVRKVYKILVDQLEQSKSITVVDLRDAIKTNRKSAIYYLEYFDRQHVTRRKDNDRFAGPAYDNFNL